MRVSRLDSIDLSRYELDPGISLLLYLYLCRSDLQVAFPEVRAGRHLKTHRLGCRPCERCV